MRPRIVLALCSLALISGLLVPRPALAGFFQSWATSAWKNGQVIGNADADASMEMVFVNKADGHYAILDEGTGAIESEFALSNESNSTYGAGDLDGDGRSEVIFHSYPHIVPPFFRAYHWNGSSYVLFIAHMDSAAYYSTEVIRTAGIREIAEISGEPDVNPLCDFRLRDHSGSVFFRASTDVPGWSRPYRQHNWIDRNHDGIQELILEDQTTARAYNQYSGGFTLAWTLAGWSQLVELGNLDGDPQSELLATNSADSHFAIVDASTGAIQQEFPTFAFTTAALGGQNVDGDAALELIVHEYSDGVQPPVYSIYDWNGATLAPLVSVTGTSPYSNLATLQLRSLAQYEIVEVSHEDFLVRDLSGALLFRGSTSVPGWSVTPFTLGFDLRDADQVGMPDLVLYDATHVWDIHYSGAFALSWVANGWFFYGDLGDMDGDPQSEFMLCSSADSTFAMYDGVTGTSQQQFSSFKYGRSYFVPFDTDADGRPELYFGSQPGETHLFTAYRWNGSTYAPLYSHTESKGQWGLVQLRHASQWEILEMDDNDIRVRDAASPTVLFRASTDLAGWSGLPYAIGTPGVEDPGQPGVYDLFAWDDAQFRVVRYSGTTAAPGPAGTAAFRVFQNAPNPFRTSTAFRISMAKAGSVGIRILDAGGRLVRRLDRKLPVGETNVLWDGRDDRGRSSPSGVLFYEVTADGIRQTRKLVRIQ